MIQIQLPNVADTDDPTVKQLIQAVQELADQSSSFDTAIFHEMNTGIQGLDQRLTSLESTVSHGFQEMSGQFDTLHHKVDKGFSELKGDIKGLKTEMQQTRKEMQQTREDLTTAMQQTREETVDLLKQIAKNTKNN